MFCTARVIHSTKKLSCIFNVNEEYFVPVVIVVAEYNGMKLITAPTSFNEERETNGTSYSVRFIHGGKPRKTPVLFVVRRLGNTRESGTVAK